MRSPSGLPCPPLPPAPLATHSLPPALPCRCACSYPLLTVVGVAASTVVYCSYRALAHNPDVHLSKIHKHDELSESAEHMERAEKYWHSIFRKAWLSRVHDGDVVDARMMRV
ncbi:hypothetical protein COHA_001330 [Chlorella ohadii]|uniref:Uncharacterized protein n=1 Tax=Chlorella ohadii TaxID=2649997 RepID=A0AAD5DW51_9CHLO|nr:hypothetical protein COHA_001330 [Chlorella ohadii]